MTKVSIISAGRDSLIQILDKNLEGVRVFDLLKQDLNPLIPCVMAIDVLEGDSKVLLGTISSEIYEFTFKEDFLKGEYEVNKIALNHCSTSTSSALPNEFSALLYMKRNEVIITTGEDYCLKIWDINSNKLLKNIKLEKEDIKKTKLYPKCLDADPEEKFVCIGYKEEFAKV